jgi:hypothetical protein
MNFSLIHQYISYKNETKLVVSIVDKFKLSNDIKNYIKQFLICENCKTCYYNDKCICSIQEEVNRRI